MKKFFKEEIHNIDYIQNHNEKSNRIPDMDAYGEYNNTIYIAMNHIKGKLLSEYIYTNQYSIQQAIQILQQLVSIIKALHELEKPFYHLDLKPSNFIIDEMDCVYLFDFGSCALVDDATVYAYSEGYSAPEVVFNKSSVIGAMADIYSLGAILYELIHKIKPTIEISLFKSYKTIKTKNSIEKVIRDLIISKTLEEDLRVRFKNCEELMKAIESLSE